MPLSSTQDTRREGRTRHVDPQARCGESVAARAVVVGVKLTTTITNSKDQVVAVVPSWFESVSRRTSNHPLG
jgi:hypothetical protein